MPLHRLFKESSLSSLHHKHISRTPPESPESPETTVVEGAVATPSTPDPVVSTLPTLSQPSDEPVVPTIAAANGVKIKTNSVEETDDVANTGALVEIINGIQKPSDGSKVERIMNTLDDAATFAQAHADTAQTVVSSLAETFDASGITHSIESSVDTFVEGVPLLMRMLDEVAKVHPFIGVAVLAFKAVYTLEMKRRANDKKIVALYVEMKDMMMVLLRLQTVKDEDEIGPDGMTVKGRMQGIVGRTARDIKDCANTCDAYSKMKFLAKVLKGPLWEGSLLQFVDLFSKRRSEFEFALSIHIGRGIDDANRKLDSLSRDLVKRTDMILNFFQTCVSPEQQKLSALIQQKGGSEAVLNSEETLKELNTLYRNDRSLQAVDPNSSLESAAIGAFDLQAGFHALQMDLGGNPATIIKNNFETFERKFAMQQRQIAEELNRVITRESDRVIETVTSGPHDKIIDRDLYTIWKEMGWRGSVKTRHFVLAIRDYYRERADDKKRQEITFQKAYSKDHDAWALEFLAPNQIQPLMESFDDDVSGFITVAEANYFTTSRPADWSLLHWLAYWAIGWQMSASVYVAKIHTLIGKIFALKELAHPANRRIIDHFLYAFWIPIVRLTMSVRTIKANPTLLARFQTYIDSEEERIRRNLEAVRFHIDDLDTLVLAMGPGRIEKYLYPLLFLLLKHVFEMFRLSRTLVIHRSEFQDCGKGFSLVIDAVTHRYEHLQELFVGQKLELKEQFKVFACGLFNYWFDPSPILTHAKLLDSKFPNFIYNDTEEAQDIKPEDILNYPVEDSNPYDFSWYENTHVETEEDRRAEGHIRALIGSWHCVLGDDKIWPYQPMMTYNLHVSVTNNQQVEASGITTDHMSSYTVTGLYEVAPDGRICYVVTRKFSVYFPNVVFRGYLSEDGLTLTGHCRPTDKDSDIPFVWSRRPPAILTFRPSPYELESNRTKALWRFALSAVEYEVQRRMFTWSFLKRRRDIRKRYIELNLRGMEYGNGRPLSQEEQKELMRCRRSLTTADACLYFSHNYYQLRTAPTHFVVDCDVCEARIGGTRNVCLDCEGDDFVDFCSDPKCTATIVDSSKREDLRSPHLPSHCLFRLRAVMHYREVGKIVLGAREARQRAQAALKEGTHECVGCKNRVTMPCWFCSVCKDNVFICDDCDSPAGISAGPHDRMHCVVKCTPPVVAPRTPSVEEQLAVLESKVSSLDSKFGQVDDRLSRMERLLESLVSKVGGDS
ncbi:hypothetical protein B0H21DRAFT_565923 [Amylocystis lapponica]|nr:hypothetical protein B0H21DRAFT_565923 [Amylocystis lapponica]